MSKTELLNQSGRKAIFRNNKKYKQTLSSLNILDCYLGIHNPSIFVVDYFNREFVMISSNPLFLCGYKLEEIQSWGFDYFKKVVPPDDFMMLKEISGKARQFFSRLPVKHRNQCFITYDTRLMHKNGKSIMVNIRLTPLYVSSRGEMRSAICIVELSKLKKAGNALIQLLDKPCRFRYSTTKKDFVECPPIILTDIEKQILKLLAYESSTDKIAASIYRSINTVKHHKKIIYKKLNANNIAQATFYAQKNKLI